MPKKGVFSVVKNECSLELLIMISRKSFLVPIRATRKGMGLPIDMKPEFLYVGEVKSDKFLKERSDDVNTKRVSFLKTLTKEKRKVLASCIKYILKLNTLGEEWFTPIADLIISGYIYPPAYNLFVKTDSKNRKVSIELNKTTTLEDIKEAWNDYIKKEQTNIFGKNKQNYFGKKTGKNMAIAFKDMQEKRPHAEEIDATNTKSYKVFDLDIVGKIWKDEEDESEETDKKRRVNLRQIRKRIKEKI